ncbi:MAG: hypothetical protein ACLFUJ_07435 [Phycisphaerae bacterium]
MALAAAGAAAQTVPLKATLVAENPTWPVVDEKSGAVMDLRVTLQIENVSDKPVSILRFNDVRAYAGDLAVGVTDPTGLSVQPFVWQMPAPKSRDGSEWGSKASHYLTLQPDESQKIDLTPGFFGYTQQDPTTAPPSEYKITPFGPRRYGLVRHGKSSVRVTLKSGGDASVAPEGFWQGTLQAGPLEVRRVADTKGISGRLAGYLKKAARGPKVQPVAATYFGGPDFEEFRAVGSQEDGTIVAFGNAWGPTFPDTGDAELTVLGEKHWLDVTPYQGGQEYRFRGQRDGQGGRMVFAGFDRLYPNRAGMIVRFAPDLSKVLSVTRFAWGNASIDQAAVGAGGKLFIAGQCTEHFEAIARKAGKMHVVPVPDSPKAGPVRYQDKVDLSGDVYVARLSPDAKTLEWVVVLRGHRSISPLWFDNAGGVSFDSWGIKRVDAQGKLRMVELTWRAGGRIRTLGVNPATGGVLRGGDRNTGTGREPWRQPQLTMYDEAGQPVWKIYDWSPGLVGHDDYRLVSDSAARVIAWDRQGDLWFSGWSDGGNSVFTRNPVDLDKGLPQRGLGMSLWGAGVGSFCHIIHMDADTWKVHGYMTFAAYLNDYDPATRQYRDKPNSVRIDKLVPFSDGALAFMGGASSYLVQTPNAFYRRLDQDWSDLPAAGGSGPFFCVLDKTLGSFLFCSTMPACDLTDLTETSRGLAVVSTTTGISKDYQSPPVVNALQPAYGGGRGDGHILLMQRPDALKGAE